jgi:predicted nucleotidyltransferase
VEAAARVWAEDVGACDASVCRIVCFGSLATGRWGVGSDLDLFIEVSATDFSFPKRTLRYDTSSLPVPADIIVHTLEEVKRQRAEKRRFIREIDEKGLVLFRRRNPADQP